MSAQNVFHEVFVVILAYGLWGTNKRSPKEIVGYGMYIKSCEDAIRHLAFCGYHVRVILCGGLQEDGVTEAESMCKYFYKFYTELSGKVALDTENFSLTTPANIWQAFDMIGGICTSLSRVLFLCDTARELKVRWLVNKCNRMWYRKLLIRNIWLEPEVLAFDRPDITPKSTKLFQFCETLVMMLVPWYLKKRINTLRRETE